jgi:hypothetical protein
MLKAIQKKDGWALTGYTLSMGVSALGLAATAFGNQHVRDAAFFLKFANSTVAIISDALARPA